LKHHANPRFWHCYNQLSEDVQRLADDSYSLLRQNPRHPSLHFKKAGRFWSVRAGLRYRALAVEEGNDLVWFWIGPHAEYNSLVKK
jgi:hypothetical protein